MVAKYWQGLSLDHADCGQEFQVIAVRTASSRYCTDDRDTPVSTYIPPCVSNIEFI